MRITSRRPYSCASARVRVCRLQAFTPNSTNSSRPALPARRRMLIGGAHSMILITLSWTSSDPLRVHGRGHRLQLVAVEVHGRHGASRAGGVRSRLAG